MARRLAEEESSRVWEQFERRLTAFDGGPEPLPRWEAVHQHDYCAYPGGFTARWLVAAQYLPDESLLSAIREGMERLSEPALYFLARECAEGDEANGLDREVSLPELTSETLAAISPGFECWLYSVSDAWAIYLHHEGFAFCGGGPEFIGAIKAHRPGIRVGNG